MSYDEEEIICPNCGSHAKGNYCYQCGQETHLHKESFWGLVMHFVGHYFHYDSKFWQTLKALVFSPGKLTIAYIERKRMRYIPPISLYIFISAVYFLSFTLPKMQEGEVVHVTSTQKSAVHGARKLMDSLDKTDNEQSDTTATVNNDPNSGMSRFIQGKRQKIMAEHGDPDRFLKEHIWHTLPKIFFFMIPVMALILKLLFARRKSTYFVDHAIYSLHFHSFFFFISLFGLIPFPSTIRIVIGIVTALWLVTYMWLSLRNVYHIKWYRILFSMLTIGFGYMIFFVVAIIIDFFAIIGMA